ncbi:MAG: sugar ABC transporter permease [Bacilli bacterium]|nr:sugar ABC transporter permease [Bacilli bacterium]
MDRKDDWKAWLYLAPVLILMAIFTFYPIVNTVIVSFLKDYDATTGSHSGFTFFNYAYVLGFAEKNPGSGVYNHDFFSWNPASHSAFWNTMFIAFVTVPISILIALLIALMIHSIGPLKKLFQTLFFLPYVTNIIAAGMVFAVIFGSDGVFNKVFGIETMWLSPASATWGSVMFVLCLYVIWNALPYKILIFLSGLEGIDQQYYQAARIDGASRAKAAIKVTVPLLSPQILYITVTSFIAGFKEYSSIIGLINRSKSSTQALGNDMYTAVYYIYDQIQSTDWSRSSQYADAAAVLLLVVILLFTLLELWLSRKKVVYR